MLKWKYERTAMPAEDSLRLPIFLGVLALMALWEVAAPQRRAETPCLIRWSNNMALVVIDSLLVRLLFPVLAVGVALVATTRGWGLFNSVSLPGWVEISLAILLLDLAIYLQHRLFHRIPLLWRLHRMHHTDTDFAVTTGLRFHPVEIILSMAIKMGIVLLFGLPAIAVLLFEIILNATALFNHGNIRLPAWIDAKLRWVLVTPDMHRIHPSVIPRETHSNFGFNLPWWDRLFGTYRDQPRDGQRGMTIGLPQFRDRRELWLDRMLLQPLRNDPVSPAAASPPPDAPTG